MNLSNYLSRLLRQVLVLSAAIFFGVIFCNGAYAQSKVVYHIDDAQAQGLKGLRNIRNHLDTAPQTKIIVVTHATGVDLLIDGAKDQKNNIEYGPLVSALKSRGVVFEVCEITLKNRNLNKNQFILDADFTPSGVVKIADLQYVDHYAYIKP
jgi:intracellular sulfur oxidation DsrE/DsrF family protein